jgi:hypothetical protein
MFQPTRFEQVTWRQSNNAATRPKGDALAPDVTTLMKNQQENRHRDGCNHPLSSRSPRREEETAHYHLRDGRNRHGHGVSMIVVLKDNRPCNSINRGKASIVKDPQFFTTYRNAVQFSTIIHFLDTIQLIITPLFVHQNT